MESIMIQMVALFAIVIVGFVCRKVGLMDEDFDRKLSNFVIQVSCPALILSSTMGDKLPSASHIPLLLLVSAATYVVLITLAYLLPGLMRVPRDLRGMYRFMLTYSNVGFIGYPVVAAIFGPEAVFYACILNIFNTITVFIWGVMFITDAPLRGGFNWKLFVSPAMVATYLSVVVVLLGWSAPEAVAKPLTILGNMTVPASLLVIGASLAGIPARKMMGTPHVFLMCVLKLFVLPMLVFYLFVYCGVERQIAAINTVLIAMPVASFGTMFCLRYGKDETTISQGTFWSTLLSVVSIPILAMIF